MMFRWQQLASASGIRQVFFLLCCLVLLLGLAYALHLRVLFSGVEAAHEQTRRMNIERIDRASRAQALASAEAQLAAANESLNVSRWRLEAGGELADLLEVVALRGDAHGVFVEHLEVLAQVLHDQHIELPMQLHLRGSYSGLAAFFHGLAQLPRLLTAQDFSLLADEENAPNGLRMQVRVSAYRSLEASAWPEVPVAEPGLVGPVPDSLRNPFQSSPQTLPREYLRTLPLEQFEMVGSLARNQVRFALLRAAGFVHRLQLGDRLGRNNGRVVRIDEREVEITEEVFVQGEGWVERTRTLGLKMPANTG